MKFRPTLLVKVLTGALLSFSALSGPVHADEIPMTINGQINCANPVNAITTTCGGGEGQSQSNGVVVPKPAETPPMTPEVTHSVGDGNQGATDCSLVSNAGLPDCQPMTINGEVNCANPKNAVTTTCWDLAHGVKNSGVPSLNTGPDCTNAAYKDFPACSGVASQIVLDYQESQKNAAPPPPAGVNCADPALIGTSDCAKPTAASAGIDCSVASNSGLPLCQPLTINGEVNCANPDNSITTTCWEQAQAIKANGGKPVSGSTTPDCSNVAFKDYPACTGIAPAAVLIAEAAKGGAAVVESGTVTSVAAKNGQVSGLVAPGKSKTPVKGAVATKGVVSKSAPEKKSIVCIKGKTKLTVTGSKCPAGYKAG